MQQNIIFKNVNNKIIIFVNPNISFECFIKSLSDRLDKLYIKDDLLKANVTLDIKNLTLDAKKILKIFDVLESRGTLYIDKIIYKENINKSLLLYEGNIRAGEIKLFPNSTLLVGNINKGSKVIVNGDLYIIGKVDGVVEFKGIKNRLMASCINESYIKICSLTKKVEGTKNHVLVMIKNDEIVIDTLMDRREMAYGESNCSYIW